MNVKRCVECGAELRLRPSRCPLCGSEPPEQEPATGGKERVARVRTVGDVDRYQSDVRELRIQLRRLRDGAEAV